MNMSFVIRLFKNRYAGVSLGLMPVLLMMILVHVFPPVFMLFLTFAVCVSLLIYQFMVYKVYNLFLLHSAFATGLIALTMLATGHLLIPENYLVLTIEILLLVCSFFYLLYPQTYVRRLKRYSVKTERIYRFVAKTVVFLFSLHLIVLVVVFHFCPTLSEDTIHVLVCLSSIAALSVGLAYNLVMANMIQQTIESTPMIRVAPVCKGKLFLIKREVVTGGKVCEEWDLPIQAIPAMEEESADVYVRRLVSQKVASEAEPRFCLKYRGEMADGISHDVLLYVLPLHDEAELKDLPGEFVALDALTVENGEKRNYSRTLADELQHLQVAACLWQQYD